MVQVFIINLGNVTKAFIPVVHGVMACGQKSFKLVWRCHQLLSGFLAKYHLPRVSRLSRRSLMIRVFNGICLTAEENLS